MNSSDILFHSSSIAVLSEPIFGWEVTFVLFSKTPNIGGDGLMEAIKKFFGGACGVMVIIVGNGHGNTSSNPGRD